MTAFETYLVFNADSFGNMFVAIMFLSFFIAVICYMSSIPVNENNKKLSTKLIKIATFNLIVVALCIVGNCTIPSTKTALAMVVIPKLTSPAALNEYSKYNDQLLILTKELVKRFAKEEK
jgi:hypothetical protein